MSIKRKILKIFNILIRKGHWFNEVEFPSCYKFWVYNTFNTEVVNLGSTSALYAFNYEGLSIKAANWALAHNPLLGDCAILKNYFSYLRSEGSTVILPLCVFSSLAGSYDICEDRYYSLLYPASIPHFSYRRQQRVKSLVKNPVLHYPLYALFSDIKYFLFRKRCIKLTEVQMEADANAWIRDWTHEFSLSDLSTSLSLINKDSINDAADILNDIIKFCRERRVRLVIVIPPMYHTLAEKFTPDIRRVFVGALLEKMINRDVVFLDYMGDEEFTNNRELFRNSFFLNKKGAKIFTRKVLTDIGILKHPQTRY